MTSPFLATGYRVEEGGQVYGPPTSASSRPSREPDTGAYHFMRSGLQRDAILARFATVFAMAPFELKREPRGEREWDNEQTNERRQSEVSDWRLCFRSGPEIVPGRRD